MHCHVARAQLQDLLEEKLPAHTVTELRLHLASCRSCQAELESWQELWSDLSGHAPCKNAPNLELRIMPALNPVPDLPKGLVFLFALASLGTMTGLLAWAEGLEPKQDLLSAFLWTVAGVVFVISIWLAVERSHQGEEMVSPQEE